jgi:hypothetical protein
MELDSVRELKQRAFDTILQPMLAASAHALRLAVAAADMASAQAVLPKRLMALGVARHDKGGYKLAVRLQRRNLLARPELKQLERLAKGEWDVRYIGQVRKRALPWYQLENRPLLIGSSVAHERVTAGTLGGFARLAGQENGDLYILSNNHVLANEGRARIGDSVLQPGPYDGASAEQRVASLSAFVKYKKKSANLVDCAIAKIDPGIEADVKKLRGLGRFKGLSSQPVDDTLTVLKIGRTTGLTHGKVTAFELDDVVVAFDAGNLNFDNQIEIEGVEELAFSDGGDSGSLVLDPEFRAVGLLFAGSDIGGSNGKGLTYVNPIRPVLDSLGIALLS